MSPAKETSPPSTQERLERLVITTSALIAEVSLEGVLGHVVQAAAELIGECALIVTLSEAKGA